MLDSNPDINLWGGRGGVPKGSHGRHFNMFHLLLGSDTKREGEVVLLVVPLVCFSRSTRVIHEALKASALSTPGRHVPAEIPTSRQLCGPTAVRISTVPVVSPNSKPMDPALLARDDLRCFTGSRTRQTFPEYTCLAAIVVLFDIICAESLPIIFPIARLTRPT